MYLFFLFFMYGGFVLYADEKSALLSECNLYNSSIFHIDSIDKKKPLRILGIGNSHTRDSFKHLWAMLHSSGFCSVIIGNGYIGSSTLEQQYKSLEVTNEYHSKFQYLKYESVDPIIKKNTTLDYIIDDEDWDILIVQITSHDPGSFISFVNDDFCVKDFISYISKRDSCKSYLLCRWSHPKQYNKGYFNTIYKQDSNYEFLSLQKTAFLLSSYLKIPIINIGMSVEIARYTNCFLGVGKKLTRDNNHLLEGIPQYIASYCIAYSITGIQPNEMNYYLFNLDSCLCDTAKQCVIKACNINKTLFFYK